MSCLLSEESYQALTVILQGANMGEGYSLIMNLPDWETHWKQSKKNWKNKAKEISRMQLLLSQKKKLIFSLKKRSWEQVLHNRYWTLCGWIIFYTSVSEVAQNNEMYVVVMLFGRLTVKAENILFIQRDKLRADRATTHRMLGLWNRECTKTKKFKRSAIQWMCINYTEVNALRPWWNQTLHFIWRSTTSSLPFRGSRTTVLGLKHKLWE